MSEGRTGAFERDESVREVFFSRLVREMASGGAPGSDFRSFSGTRPRGRDYPAVSRCTRSRNTPWSGQALERRTLTVRVFRVTTAPILSSRRRRVWHCARAKSVPRSIVRRIVSSSV